MGALIGSPRGTSRGNLARYYRGASRSPYGRGEARPAKLAFPRYSGVGPFGRGQACSLSRQSRTLEETSNVRLAPDPGGSGGSGGRSHARGFGGGAAALRCGLHRRGSVSRIRATEAELLLDDQGSHVAIAR